MMVESSLVSTVPNGYGTYHYFYGAGSPQRPRYHKMVADQPVDRYQEQVACSTHLAIWFSVSLASERREMCGALINELLDKVTEFT
jgi:hypothetical protein